MLVFTIEFWESFIYSRYWSFVRYVVHKHFPPVCILSFHSLHKGLWSKSKKLFNEVRHHSFSFYGSCFCVKLKNSLSRPSLLRRFLKVIFSISFIVLCLYLESILSRDLRFRLRFFFFFFDSGFLIASFVKICLFFPLNCFCSVVKNKLEIFDWIYFWFLYSIPLIFVSISLQISHCLYYCSYLIGFNVRWNYSSYFIF